MAAASRENFGSKSEVAPPVAEKVKKEPVKIPIVKKLSSLKAGSRVQPAGHGSNNNGAGDSRDEDGGRQAPAWVGRRKAEWKPEEIEQIGQKKTDVSATGSASGSGGDADEVCLFLHVFQSASEKILIRASNFAIAPDKV